MASATGTECDWEGCFGPSYGVDTFYQSRAKTSDMLPQYLTNRDLDNVAEVIKYYQVLKGEVRWWEEVFQYKYTESRNFITRSIIFDKALPPVIAQGASGCYLSYREYAKAGRTEFHGYELRFPAGFNRSSRGVRIFKTMIFVMSDGLDEGVFAESMFEILSDRPYWRQLLDTGFYEDLTPKEFNELIRVKNFASIQKKTNGQHKVFQDVARMMVSWNSTEPQYCIAGSALWAYVCQAKTENVNIDASQYFTATKGELIYDLVDYFGITNGVTIYGLRELMLEPQMPIDLLLRRVQIGLRAVLDDTSLDYGGDNTYESNKRAVKMWFRNGQQDHLVTLRDCIVKSALGMGDSIWTEGKDANPLHGDNTMRQVIDKVFPNNGPAKAGSERTNGLAWARGTIRKLLVQTVGKFYDQLLNGFTNQLVSEELKIVQWDHATNADHGGHGAGFHRKGDGGKDWRSLTSDGFTQLYGFGPHSSNLTKAVGSLVSTLQRLFQSNPSAPIVTQESIVAALVGGGEEAQNEMFRSVSGFVNHFNDAAFDNIRKQDLVSIKRDLITKEFNGFPRGVMEAVLRNVTASDADKPTATPKQLRVADSLLKSVVKMDLAMTPIDRVIATIESMYMSQRGDTEFYLRCEENNVRIPWLFVLDRPHIEYRAHALVFMDQPCTTYYGAPIITAGMDLTKQEIVIKAKMHYGAMVANPEQLFILEGAGIEDYVRGDELEFYDVAKRDLYWPAKDCYGALRDDTVNKPASIFVKATRLADLHAMPDPCSISDEWEYEYRRSLKIEAREREHIFTGKFYCRLWDFNTKTLIATRPDALGALDFSEANRLLYRARQQLYNYITGAFDIETVETGWWDGAQRVSVSYLRKLGNMTDMREVPLVAK